MSYENVKLWFAKNDKNEIVTITDIDENNKKNTYLCPVCGSELKPKAIKSAQVTSHFAHIDAEKCNSETMIHWWFKHKFIEEGDIITVVSDIEKDYICKEILVEKEYEVDNKTYRPDVTIKTKCGNEIYFEMAFSNKKKIQDYLDIWLGLNNIVVEVDIKHLINQASTPYFKALFYEGKCFNVKKSDSYYNTIGKYKEHKLKGKVDKRIKDRIVKLDWLWEDIFRYKKGEININSLSESIDCIDNEDLGILEQIFKKPSCVNIMHDYMENKLIKNYKKICEYVEKKYGENYKRYISKDFSYIKRPFVGSWYESKIIIKDLTDESASVFDFSDRDKTEQVLNEIDLIIPKNKNIEIYNANVEMLQNKIYQNHKYKNMISNLNLKEEYKPLIKVNRYRRNLVDKFMLTFELKFNDRKISSCSFGKKVDINDDIDYYIDQFERNINNYFFTLESLDDIKGLENLSKSLSVFYEGYELCITNEILFEDVCRISVNYNDGFNFQVYYVFKDCVSYDINKDQIISDINNYKEVKDCIMTDINKILKEDTKENCYDCGNEFFLDLGELKFFIKKGFENPKRCKSCRNKRKQSKQGV